MLISCKYYASKKMQGLRKRQPSRFFLSASSTRLISLKPTQKLGYWSLDLVCARRRTAGAGFANAAHFQPRFALPTILVPIRNQHYDGESPCGRCSQRAVFGQPSAGEIVARHWRERRLLRQYEIRLENSWIRAVLVQTRRKRQFQDNPRLL